MPLGDDTGDVPTEPRGTPLERRLATRLARGGLGATCGPLVVRGFVGDGVCLFGDPHVDRPLCGESPVV